MALRHASPAAVGWLVLGLIVALPASGQDDPPVAATVDNATIWVADVDGLVARSLHGQTLSPIALAVSRAEAVKQLIGQVLVLEYLDESQMALTESDVQLELERLEKSLSAIGKTLDQYLVQQQQTRSGLLRQIRFRGSWQKYLDTMLTDENLQKHFEKHRLELDGSRMHVRHLLLATSAADAIPQLMQKASTIRARITAGEISWEDAVRENSAAPSAANAGDLKWIQRRGPMPESFSKAAFALNPGDISPPVTTPFGVHLIQCVAIEPGGKSWQDCREETEKSATQFLFDWIVEKQSATASIEYSGNCPHWDSEGRLIGG